MGSQKQATALIGVINKIRRSRQLGELSTQQVNDYTSRVLGMGLPDVQAEFTKYNAVTGFDRHSSPATIAQLRKIKELELGVYGQMRTTYLDGLTFAHASDLIDSLVAMRAETKADIRQLEALANSGRLNDSPAKVKP